MEQSINDKLMDAVAFHDPETVKKCLENGADANYTLYSDDEEPDGYIQPTTPLRLVMFRISDSLLEEGDMEQFAVIAKILVQYGADPKPAMIIAEHRYGKYNPAAEKDSFMKVWDIVANA